MDSGFAPEAVERKITKTASISNEVKRGEFDAAELQIRNAIKTSNAIIDDENINEYESGKREYKTASFRIRVDTSKYDATIAQLKEVGKVTSFNENKDDVTDRYLDLEDDLAVEKARLNRFNVMLAEAEETKDKIQLTDRIYNLERTIKHYEDSIANIDERIDYSTVYISLKEKPSDFADIMSIKLSDISRAIVNSFNSLVKLIFILLPWAILALIIWAIVKISRRGKGKKRK